MNTKRVLLLRMPSPALRKARHPVHYYPPLTLKYIQSVLKPKMLCDVNLIDGWIEPLTLEELLKKTGTYKPDIMVVFSNFISPDYVLAFLTEIKHLLSNLFVIVIGPDASWNRDKFLSSGSPVDVIIPGDAEKEPPALIVKLCSGEMDRTQARNIYRERFKEQDSLIILNDPESLPFPEFSKEELLKYVFIYPVRLNKRVCCGYLKTSWGCPHHCIFCSQAIRKSYGSRVRLRSAKNVVDEIEYLMEQGANFISFDDDDFTFSREHILSICREIERRNLKIKWAAQTRIDEVDSYLLKEMKTAGCDFLQFGIESGSERIMYLLKKTDCPERWIPRSKEVFKEAKKAGIATCALFMIGSPTETEEDVRQSMKLAYSLQPDLLKLHFFYPYPGSEVYENFFRKVKDVKSESKYHHDYPSHLNLSKMDLDKMVMLRKEFYKTIYLNPTFIVRHLFRYSLYYLHNPGNLKYLTGKLMQLFFTRQEVSGIGKDGQD